MSTEAKDLALLDHVLMRIASVSTDDEMEKQLEALLCAVIMKFSTQHASVKAKLMGILAHINEILTSRPQVRLPVAKLIVQYTSEEVPPNLKHFSAIYLQKGLVRESMETAIPHCKTLLKQADKCPEKELPYRFFVPLLPAIVKTKADLVELGLLPEEQEEEKEGVDEARPDAAKEQAPLQRVYPEQLHTLIQYIADFLRLANTDTQKIKPLEGTTALPPAPPGLSRNLLRKLVMKDGKVFQHPTKADVIAWKRDVISLLCKPGLFPEELASRCLMASCGDVHSDISEHAVNALRKISIDLESEPLIDFLSQCVTLSMSSADQKTLHPDDRRTVNTAKARAGCMQRLMRSQASYHNVARCLKCVFACIENSQGNAKLIALGLDYMKNMLHYSPQAHVDAFCPLLFAEATKVIDDPSQDVSVHSRAYSNLGMIARKTPKMRQKVAADFPLLRKLFKTAASGPPSLTTHVVDTLNLMRDCYKEATPDVQSKVVTLLLEHITHARAPIRSAALQYAIHTFPASHVESKFVVLLAVGDDHHDVQEEASAFLLLKGMSDKSTSRIDGDSSSRQQTRENPSATSDMDSGEDMYDSSETVVTTKNSGNDATSTTTPATASYLSSLNKAAVADLVPSIGGLMVLYRSKFLADGPIGGTGATARDPHLDYKQAVVEAALGYAMRCAHAHATGARSKGDYEAVNSSDRGWYAQIRSFFLAMNERDAEGKDPVARGPHASSSVASATEALLAFIASVMHAANYDSLYLCSLEAMHAMQCCVPELCVSSIAPIVHKLKENLHSTNTDIRNAAAKVLGLFAVSDPDSTESLLSYCARNMADVSDVASVSRAGGCCSVAATVLRVLPSGNTLRARFTKEIVLAAMALLKEDTPHGTVREDLKVSASDALHDIFHARDTASSSLLSRDSWESVVTTLSSLCKPAPVKISKKGAKTAATSVLPEHTVAALGAIASAIKETHPDLFRQCLLSIYDTANYRQFEMNLTAGDALTIALGGAQSQIGRNWCREEVFEPFLQGSAPPLSTLTSSSSSTTTTSDSGSSSSNTTATVTAASHDDQGDSDTAAEAKRPKTASSLASGIDFVLEVRCRSVKAAERHAAAVWLVAFLKHCSKIDSVVEALPLVQDRLLDILAEGDEVMQEVASHGLEMCYDLGTAEMKATLVSALTSALAKGHKSSSQKFTQKSDDVVFEGNELGKTKDGSGLNTYRELTSLAADLNQPDLIYRFMSLANHNILWNSRRGAAYGFGRLMKHTQLDATAQLGSIIPKLYRYRFDPNPRTRAAMNNIWRSLVSDPIKAVDRNFEAIAKDLIKSATGREWRVREASGYALAEVLRGRTWMEVQHVFMDIWMVAFRVIDDVKESVRKAGADLCKRLSKLSATLCAAPTSGAKVIALLLPFITNEGLVSKVNDVKGVSLAVIISITKDAGLALKPHLSTLIMTLLDALSGLESPYLDYIGQRLSAHDGLEEHLDDARMSASKTSPIAQCLSECVAQIDAAILPEFMPPFLKKCKQDNGASTKAGCARVASDLVRICGKDLQPYTKSLLKTLLTCATSRSAPVRRDFGNALGTVCKVATIVDVGSMLKRAKKFYLGHESVEKMEASCVAVRAVGQRAPDTFAAHLQLIVPLCFYGKHDDSKIVRGVWQDVWHEATKGTEKATVRLFAQEIFATIRPRLTDRLWTVKKQASAALSSALKHCDANAIPDIAALIDDVMLCTQGRTWIGKEAAVEALTDLIIKFHEALNQKAAPAHEEKMTTDENGETSLRKSLSEDAASAEAQGRYHTLFDQAFAVVLRESSKRDREYKAKNIPLLAKMCAIIPTTDTEKPEQVCLFAKDQLKKYRPHKPSTMVDGESVNTNNNDDDNNDEEEEDDDDTQGGNFESTETDAEQRKRINERAVQLETIRATAIDVIAGLFKHSDAYLDCYDDLRGYLSRALLDGPQRVKVSACRAIAKGLEHCGNADTRALALFEGAIEGIERFGVRTSPSTVRQGIATATLAFARARLHHHQQARNGHQPETPSSSTASAPLSTKVGSASIVAVVERIVAVFLSDSAVGVKTTAAKIRDILESGKDE